MSDNKKSVPFSLPLRPHGQQNQDNIDDADGWPVIIIYGNPDDPLTLRRMEYVIAAVNSHEELKRQRDEQAQFAQESIPAWIHERVVAGMKEQKQRAETAEAQRDELLKALEDMHGVIELLANRYCGYLPHENASGIFHSRNEELSADTRTRLAFIEDMVKKADDLLAKYKRGDQQ